MLLYNKDIFKRCFSFPKKYWYKNIKYIPLYFSLIHHLVKYGYDEFATWETFDWFIRTMRDVLKRVRDHHDGVPPQLTNEEWNEILNRMTELLDLMDEDNLFYDFDFDNESCDYFQHAKTQMNVQNAAKEEFFELFSKHFYELWD